MSTSPAIVGFSILLGFALIPRLLIRGITLCPHCGGSTYVPQSWVRRKVMRFCPSCGEEFEMSKTETG